MLHSSRPKLKNVPRTNYGGLWQRDDSASLGQHLSRFRIAHSSAYMHYAMCMFSHLNLKR